MTAESRTLTSDEGVSVARELDSDVLATRDSALVCVVVRVCEDPPTTYVKTVVKVFATADCVSSTTSGDGVTVGDEADELDALGVTRSMLVCVTVVVCTDAPMVYVKTVVKVLVTTESSTERTSGEGVKVGKEVGDMEALEVTTLVLVPVVVEVREVAPTA